MTRYELPTKYSKQSDDKIIREVVKTVKKHINQGESTSPFIVGVLLEPAYFSDISWSGMPTFIWQLAQALADKCLCYRLMGWEVNRSGHDYRVNLTFRYTNLGDLVDSKKPLIGRMPHIKLKDLHFLGK